MAHIVLNHLTESSFLSHSLLTIMPTLGLVVLACVYFSVERGLHLLAAIRSSSVHSDPVSTLSGLWNVRCPCFIGEFCLEPDFCVYIQVY